MVSGYCHCGFPASVQCPKCLTKLCGNCFPVHKCTVPLVEHFEPNEIQQAALDAPAPVNAYKKKPGRPPVKK